MKSYYQQKKGGWTLNPVIYAKTVKQIRCYRYFQERIRSVKELSEERVREKDIQNKIVAEHYVQAIDRGLQLYVPEEYRKAVFEHVVDEMDYLALEEKYFISTAVMKRYVQVFVYGVAEELGENFDN